MTVRQWPEEKLVPWHLMKQIAPFYSCYPAGCGIFILDRWTFILFDSFSFPKQFTKEILKKKKKTKGEIWKV